VGTYLDGIVAYHRHRAAEEATLPGTAALESLARLAPPPRPFAAALRAPAISVIAEVKRRSPSKGDLRPDLDATELARCYEEGGAACLSVLTDAPHFGGSAEDLQLARAATSLPVLRKDFTVCEADVWAARAMGADAVLLIVAALQHGELERFLGQASELGMASLVEVHDEAELDAALGAGAELVGVNQRDLRSFDVDTQRAVRLAGRIPEGVVSVAESGISSREDVSRLEAAGFDAVLVGESLVMAASASSAVANLRGATEAAPCS
jgi:indole-3-glycerol phosphate synthase